MTEMKENCDRKEAKMMILVESSTARFLWVSGRKPMVYLGTSIDEATNERNRSETAGKRRRRSRRS